MKKETGNSEGNEIGQLVAYNGSLQLAHWAADTITNEHKAIGDLYEEMVDFVDTFAEVYMGKNGVITPCEQTITKLENPCADGLALVKELTSRFTVGEDDDLLNILADMQGALNKTQ